MALCSGCVVAFGGSVSRNFFNSLFPEICLSSSQPLFCVPLQLQTFYQNLVLVAEYHVNC